MNYPERDCEINCGPKIVTPKKISLDYNYSYFRCSCGARFCQIERYNYCYKCGAKLIWEEEEK